MNIQLAQKLKKQLVYFSSHPDYDVIFDNILTWITDELLETTNLKQEVEKWKKQSINVEMNYFKERNKLMMELQGERDRLVSEVENYKTQLKNQMEDERQKHDNDMKNKWESIYNEANIAAMKKYQPAKFEKLKLDVEFNFSMCDLEKIKFDTCEPKLK